MIKTQNDMILIADSGSTKTDWCVAEQGVALKRISTKGMNPFFQSEEEMVEAMQTSLLPELEGRCPKAVYFYGAGCAFDKVELVRRAIAHVLPLDAARIEVNSDMLAAARSVCGHEAGIACIMGTGSNSCFYNGEEIVANVSPLGFILGDEGSGAVLGKLLVGDLLKNQLPAGLKEEFLTTYKLTPAEIIDRVYRQPFPNRFLASLSPFLAAHLDVPEVRELVKSSFKAFLKRNVMQYDYRRYKVGFNGSVAWYYRQLLTEAMDELGLQQGLIIKGPMEGLLRYHAK